jgi:hypothetical protein
MATATGVLVFLHKKETLTYTYCVYEEL